MPEIVHEIFPVSNAGLDRRGFLKSLGGGLLVLLAWDHVSTAQESGNSGSGEAQKLPQNVRAWLHIAPDGRITAFTGKVEVGQNIRTSLTQAVADELRCAPGSVQLVMGDTSLTPWDAGTFGSRTTPTMAPQLRRVAAMVRETLMDEAAQHWKVDRSRLRVMNGCVCDEASGRKMNFGELAAKIDWVNVVAQSDHVTSPAQWQVAGTNWPKVNAKEMVSGKHKYTSDHKLPGMLYGRVLRPPSFGAKLVSADTSAASKIPGIQVVRDGNFIGVVASDEQKAQKALLSINAKWEQQPQISGSDLFPFIQANAKGNTPPAAPPGGSHALQSTYTVAYIAHVPLEPRAAVAAFEGDKLTVWTGTQRPFGVRSELASAIGLADQQVRVLMPDAGSGYGGKHNGECAIEAARLAKGVGKPVKLIWSREEEFTWAYLRPAGVIEIRSAADQDGALQAWTSTITCRAPPVFKRHMKFRPGTNIFIRSNHLCARAPIEVWPQPRITLLVSRTWMNWRRRWAWTLLSFAGKISRMSVCWPSSTRRQTASGGRSRARRQAEASGSPAAWKKAAISPVTPRSR
jgi:nicotinate dehydrogenase subunit B